MYQFTAKEKDDYYLLHKFHRAYPAVYYNQKNEAIIDEQGNYYAYKILIFCPQPFRIISYPIGDFETVRPEFVSPVYPNPWTDFFMRERHKISNGNMFGVYSLKSIGQRQMCDYAFEGRFDPEMINGSIRVLVKLLLSGDVIEGEGGFRSSEATIIGVSRLKDDRNMWYTPQEVVGQVGKRLPEYRGVSYGYRKDGEDYSGYPAPYSNLYP